MNRLSRLSLGQRVILVIGLAAVLGLIASFVSAAGTLTGWTGYAPLSPSSQPLLAPVGLPPFARLLVWLGAVAVWVAGSLPLMRRGSGAPAAAGGTPAAAPGGVAARNEPSTPV